MRLEIDTAPAYPLDLLLAYVEAELREVLRLPKGRRRQRPGRSAPTADFALMVFDRVIAGAPFSRIAAELRKRVSTVKSAHVRACRAIGISAPVPRRRAPIQGTDWERFDWTEHVKSCADCLKATTAEEMCPALRAYATQDTRGRRENLSRTPPP